MVQQGDKLYVFSANDKTQSDLPHWGFTPIEIYPGIMDDGWVEITFKDSSKSGFSYALNNAYVLMAELKKGKPNIAIRFKFIIQILYRNNNF